MVTIMNLFDEDLPVAPHIAVTAVGGPVITVFTKQGGIISKRIVLMPDGTVKSDASDCKMWAGCAKRAMPSSAGDLAILLQSVRSEQALALGGLPDGIPDDVQVVTKRELGV